MSNSFTAIVNLGKDPEQIELGGRPIVKLRCAEKAASKKSETRWFTTLVGGPDVATGMRLAKGDTICVTGELSLTKYKARKPRYKGEEIQDDEVPFGKILKVLKSPSFFAEQAPVDEGAPTADAPAGDEAPDIAPPDLEGL